MALCGGSDVVKSQGLWERCVGDVVDLVGAEPVQVGPHDRPIFHVEHVVLLRGLARQCRVRRLGVQEIVRTVLEVVVADSQARHNAGVLMWG